MTENPSWVQNWANKVVDTAYQCIDGEISLHDRTCEIALSINRTMREHPGERCFDNLSKNHLMENIFIIEPYSPFNTCNS